MKTVSIVLASALLAGTGVSALADDNRAIDTTQRIEITAPGGAMKAARVVLELRHLDNVYAMSTGRKLAVTAAGETLLMRYGTRLPVNLTHDGKGSFVSRDGRFELQFGLDDSGDPQLVRLTLPAELI